jgi:cell wall-associated NlpC family hydrolase
MRVASLAFFLAVGLLGFAGCQEALPIGPPGALVTPRRPPLPDSGRARTVLAFAEAQVGRPYCWGGTGPRCFDCSGLTQRAWGEVGVKLPRTADAVPTAIPEVALWDVQPGDILWWPGHVGLYAGDGWTVEALNARSGVVMRHGVPPRRAFRPRG